MTTTDHTYIRNIPEGHLIYCTHCHGAQIVPLPAPLAEWSAAVERFARQHRHCQPQTAAATAPAEPNKEQPQ